METKALCVSNIYKRKTLIEMGIDEYEKEMAIQFGYLD